MAASDGRPLLGRKVVVVPVTAVLTLLVCAAAAPAWIATSLAPVPERLRGVYLQQAIEVATVDDHTIFLTRFTRFKKCGGTRGAAQEYNNHIVEVLGRETPGIGFVAGIVNLVEGCAAAAGGSSGGS